MPGTPVGGPPSYKGGPASISGTTGIGIDGVIASPVSVAPSPLATPRSQQPASVPQQEPPMPTLSPQSNNNDNKLPAATPDTVAPKSVSSVSNQVRKCEDSMILDEADSTRSLNVLIFP